MFQASFVTLAAVLTLCGRPSLATALTASDATWLAVAAPVLVCARAQQLHLSFAHKG